MSETATVLTPRFDAPPKRRVVLVTGMSGAGRSTALRALEDTGYEAVDNLPLSLLNSLIRPEDGIGRPIAVELSADNWRQLYVPPGFAHGFCTLTPKVEVLYRMTQYYAAEADRGLAFDDPDLAISWPVEPSSAILSEKDRRHPCLRDLPAYFSFEPVP